jgi:hypothetical protein
LAIFEHAGSAQNAISSSGSSRRSRIGRFTALFSAVTM